MVNGRDSVVSNLVGASRRMKIAQQFTAGIRAVARQKSVKRTAESTDNEFSRPLHGLRVCMGSVIPPMNRWAIFGRPVSRTLNGNPVATAPGSNSVSESRFVYGQAEVGTRAVESRQKQL